MIESHWTCGFLCSSLTVHHLRNILFRSTGLFPPKYWVPPFGQQHLQPLSPRAFITYPVALGRDDVSGSLFYLNYFSSTISCATKVKFYFFTTVSRQDTIIQNIYIICNRKHNSNAQTIITQMKKKITKTLLIEPEDEKIEMVNNVIHQSIEELLVPYEKRRTYLPRKPPK